MKKNEIKRNVGIDEETYKILVKLKDITGASFNFSINKAIEKYALEKGVK